MEGLKTKYDRIAASVAKDSKRVIKKRVKEGNGHKETFKDIQERFIEETKRMEEDLTEAKNLVILRDNKILKLKDQIELVKMEAREEKKKLSKDPQIRQWQLDFQEKKKHVGHLEKKLQEAKRLILVLQGEKGELVKNELEFETRLSSKQMEIDLKEKGKKATEKKME